jgi:hypothetical protein
MQVAKQYRSHGRRCLATASILQINFEPQPAKCAGCNPDHLFVALLEKTKERPARAKLFATTCMDCHRSPRGLAKDRFSWTLSYFFQQHYTSSPTSAHALTAYLQSVDAPRAKPQPAARTRLIDLLDIITATAEDERSGAAATSAGSSAGALGISSRPPPCAVQQALGLGIEETHFGQT